MQFSKIYSSPLPNYKEENTPPFNELILSWNGLRPKVGKWNFSVSLKEGEWLPYAEWTSSGQRSFQSEGAFAQSYQDVVTPKEGLATRFQIKVEGDDLSGLHRLIVCLSNLTNHKIYAPQNLSPVLLPRVPRQSQLLLDHPRAKDLCSPTSTSTALNYLLGCRKIDPVAFANATHDQGFDIHGNWILNVAEGYNQSRIPCHVERLTDFAALHAQFLNGRPVVVSVKGILSGAPKPYPSGHLICVIGFEGGKVLCIDPAFPDNESTFIGYDLDDFLKAWGVRRNLSYVFP
ncbi:MAG TPA: C39 family peptidase [Chlamydiales bacterium]|nr:C39 family peptidase [Chlamydiales bacterium]